MSNPEEKVVPTEQEVIRVLESIMARRTRLETYKERLEKQNTMGKPMNEKLIEEKRRVLEKELAGARGVVKAIENEKPKAALVLELHYIEGGKIEACCNCMNCSRATYMRNRTSLIKIFQEHPELLEALK